MKNEKPELRKTIRFVGGLPLTPQYLLSTQPGKWRKEIVYCTIAFRNLMLNTIHIEKDVPMLYNPVNNTIEDVERIVLYPPDDAIVTDAVMVFKKGALLETECSFTIPIHDQRVGIKSFGLLVKWEAKNE